MTDPEVPEPADEAPAAPDSAAAPPPSLDEGDAESNEDGSYTSETD